MSEQIGGLSVELTAEASEYSKALRAARQSLEKETQGMMAGFAGFQRSVQASFAPILTLKAILAGAAVGGFALAVKGALDMAGALQDLSDSTGISTDTLQEMRYAFGQVGVDAGESGQALQRFAASVGDARNGTGPLVSALKDTNREFLETLRTAPSLDAALDSAFQQLAKIPDAAQRAALAQDLFGKQGVKLAAAVKDGTAGLAAMRQQARDLGLVLDADLIASADDAGDKVQALAQTLDVQFKRALISLTPLITSVTQSMSDMAVAFGKTWFDQPQSLEQLSARLAGLRAQRESAESAPSFLRGRILEDIDKQIAELQGLIAKQVELIAKKEQEARARQGNVRAIEDEAKALREAHELLKDDPWVSQSKVGGSDMERRSEIFERNRTALERYEEELAELNRLFKEGDPETYVREFTRLTDEYNRASDGAQELSRASRETDDVMRQLGLTFGDAFADAIVDGRELSEVLRALQRDLARLAVRGLVTQAIAAMFTGGGGTGGGDAVTAGINVGPRAIGGPVSAGSPYLVGERRPELFVPGNSGKIMPNDALGGTTIFLDARGADAGAVARIETALRGLNATVESRAWAATVDFQRRGGRG